MSSDNGIYIAKFPDGYRVIEACAIDNIDYDPIGSKERKETLKSYFEGCTVFPTIQKAMQEALRIHDKFGYTEYGIRILPHDYELWD